MPTIRAIRPTDLIPLIAFFRNGAHCEVTAQVWPAMQGDAATRVIRDLFRRLMVHPGGYSQAWICSSEGAVRGLAIARPRAGKLAWDVHDLFVDEARRPLAIDLLEQVAAEATRSGARRLFLYTVEDDETLRIAKQAGFTRYTSETLFSATIAAPIAANGLPPARPRLRQDTHSLFQLYNASVPCKVRFAEAVTIEEWFSLERGNRPWRPRLGGGVQHLVWDDGTGLAAWLQVTIGSRSQHVSLLVHPSHSGVAEEMVRYSLSQTSHKAPVFVSAREYQPEVVSALVKLGFERVVEYAVFTREMTARVPNRAFVPARA